MAAYSVMPLKNNYDFIGNFHEGVACVRNNSKDFNLGYIDKMCNEIIPMTYFGKFVVGKEPRFIHFPLFIDDRAALINDKGKFGYVNKKNEICVPFAYDNTFCFSEGFAAVKKGTKWSFVNQCGDSLTSFDYDMAYDFFGDFALVIKNGKAGYMNKRGEIVIDIQFDNQNSPLMNSGFYCGYATVVKNKKMGVINKRGEYIVDLNAKYIYIGPFIHGYAIFRSVGNKNNSSNFGVMDGLGNIVFEDNYRYLEHFGKDFMAIDDTGRALLINNNGKIDKNLAFDQVGALREDYAFIKKGNKYGFINKYADLVIPLEYDMAYSFNEGYAVVQKEGKFGCIDKKGNPVIPFVFESATPLSEGVSIVTQNGEKKLCILE